MPQRDIILQVNENIAAFDKENYSSTKNKIILAEFQERDNKVKYLKIQLKKY